MNKKKLTAQTSSSVALLALLSTLVQANSIQHVDMESLELDMEKAALAASYVIPGDVIEAELELENDSAIWEIDIVNTKNQVITVEVDAQTGQILSTQFDDNTDLKPADVLSLNKAISIVQAMESGAMVDAELEQEQGEQIWEVETLDNTNQKFKYRVNAETGEILL